LKNYLRHLLKNIENSHRDDGKWNSLQLAVYLKLPMVVRWLLSNGGYLSENDIKGAEKLTQGWNAEVPANRIIKDLLKDPPPILRTQAPGDDHHQPMFQKPEESAFGSLDGTVLDFLQDHNQANFHLKRRQVGDIIYKKGPQVIIRQCKYRKQASGKLLATPVLCLVNKERIPRWISKSRRSPM
jgi:hypothetical protein